MSARATRCPYRCLCFECDPADVQQNVAGMSCEQRFSQDRVVQDQDQDQDRKYINVNIIKAKRATRHKHFPEQSLLLSSQTAVWNKRSK